MKDIKLESKEIFTPLADVFKRSPYNVRETTFRFGPMIGTFILKDCSKLPLQIRETFDKLITYDGKKVFPKRFVICAFFNDERAYYIESIEDTVEAWNKFKNIIERLKHGEEVELVDYAGYSHPLRLSYRGVQWLW